MIYTLLFLLSMVGYVVSRLEKVKSLNLMPVASFQWNKKTRNFEKCVESFESLFCDI